MPGLGRSSGEGIDYPLQYSWASPVAQLLKNLPAMRETWVRSLGWEDPLEKKKSTHPGILAWRIPWTSVHGVAKSRTQLSDFHLTIGCSYIIIPHFTDDITEALKKICFSVSFILSPQPREKNLGCLSFLYWKLLDSIFYF